MSGVFRTYGITGLKHWVGRPKPTDYEWSSLGFRDLGFGV